MRRDRDQQSSATTGQTTNTAAGTANPNPPPGALVVHHSSQNMFGSTLTVPSLEVKIRQLDSRAKDSRRIFIANLPVNIKEDEVRRTILAKLTKVRRDMINIEKLKMARTDEHSYLGIGGTSSDDNNENNNIPSSSTNNNMDDPEFKKKFAKYLLPADAVVDMDVLVDVNLIEPKKMGQSPIAFVELLLDDIVTKLVTDEIEIEFVQEATSYAPRQIITCKCRRTAHYTPMTGIDDTKIYLAGIPNAPTLKDQFEEIFKGFGDLDTCSAVGGVGFYVEYREPLSAQKAVQALCGEVFNERAVYCSYATEAMRVWLMARGIEVHGVFEDEELFEIASSGANLDFKYSNSTIFAPDPLRDFYQDVFNRRLSLTQTLANFVFTQKHLRKSWPVVTPSRILVLMNLFDPEIEFAQSLSSSSTTNTSNNNIINSEERRQQLIQEFRRDIEEEVEKYGRVRNLFLITDPPRPPVMPTTTENNNHNTTTNSRAEQLLQMTSGNNSISDDLVKKKMTPEEEKKNFDRLMLEWHKQKLHPVFGETGVGKVFIEYETVKEAERAQQAIAGRLFNGRTVITSYLFEDVLYPTQDDENDEEEEKNNNKNKKKQVGEEQQQSSTLLKEDSAAAAAAPLVEEKKAEVTVTSLEDDLD